jgi:hypothetical protein
MVLVRSTVGWDHAPVGNGTRFLLQKHATTAAGASIAVCSFGRPVPASLNGSACCAGTDGAHRRGLTGIGIAHALGRTSRDHTGELVDETEEHFDECD